MRTRHLRVAVLVAAVATLVGCGDGTEEQTRPANTMTTSTTAVEAAVLLVCLGPDASSADVQTLLSERTSVPSDTGVGTDLVVGIIAVAVRTHGIVVELDPLITADRRDELIAMLEAEPVVSVDAGEGDC